MKRIIAIAAVGALASAGIAIAALPASATAPTYSNGTAYVIEGQDPTLAKNANLSSLNEYYYYGYSAIDAWNADADGAETWGGTAVNLVDLGSNGKCPALGDFCIYAVQGSFAAIGDSDSEGGFGSYYPDGALGSGVGERGYLTINTDVNMSEEQRMTILTHEFGHALGIPYDGNNDPTDLMSDTAVVSVQGITYAEYQEVGQRTK